MEVLKARSAIFLIVALAAALLLTLACSDDDDDADDDDRSPTPTASADGPHIRGHITTKTEGISDEILGNLLIEGEIEADTEYDKASVRVDGETEIFELVSGELQESDWEALAEGQLVEATFEGAVAESYPVQAYASRIVILPQDLASPTP